MNETFIAPKGNLFYTHGNHNKHNHKKHRININKRRIKAKVTWDISI